LREQPHPSKSSRADAQSSTSTPRTWPEQDLLDRVCPTCASPCFVECGRDEAGFPYLRFVLELGGEKLFASQRVLSRVRDRRRRRP
jgi:hypothetical protein